MDGDIASAARKLPQTAANFFVGTNSRVPRMTLAQSTHVIPMPAVNPPTITQPSHVVRNKLRASPFPNSPTFTKELSSPRTAAKPGGKVAKAIDLFSHLAEEVPRPSSERLGSPPASSFFIDTNASAAAFFKNLQSPSGIEPPSSPGYSVSSESIVRFLDTHASINRQSPDIEALSQSSLALDLAATQSHSVAEILNTPASSQLSSPADQESSPAATIVSSGKASFRASSSSSHVDLADTGVPLPLVASNLLQDEPQCNSNPNPMTSEYAFSAATSRFGQSNSSSLPTNANIAATDVLMPHIASPVPDDGSQRDSKSFTLAPKHALFASSTAHSAQIIPFSNVPQTPPQALFLSHTGLIHNHVSEGQAEGDDSDDACLEVVESMSIPIQSDTKFDSSSPYKVAKETGVPYSAFSDATVPSASITTEEEDRASAESGVRQQDISAAQKLSPLTDDRSTVDLSPQSALPFSVNVLSTATALRTDDLSTTTTLPFPAEAFSATSALPTSRSASRASSIESELPIAVVTRDMLTLKHQARPVSPGENQPHSGHVNMTDRRSVLDESGSDENADVKCFDNQRLTRKRESGVNWENLGPSLLPDEEESSCASFERAHHQGAGSPDDRVESSHLAHPGIVSAAAARGHSIGDQQHQRSSSPHPPRDETRDSYAAILSVLDSTVLFDLIGMDNVPASPQEEPEPQEPRLDRTATWIKSTMGEHDPIAEELTSPRCHHINETLLLRESVLFASQELAQSKPLRDLANSKPCFANPHDDELTPCSPQYEPVLVDKHCGHVITNREAANASTCSPKREVQAEVTRDYTALPRNSSLTRSYSQRDPPSQHAPKQAKRVPGRLKILAKSPEASTYHHRDSLKLLSMSSVKDSRVKEQSSPPKQIAICHLDRIETGRVNDLTEMLNSLYHGQDSQATQSTPLSRGKQYVGQMVQDWNDANSSGEDDEVASVATCKRMTLKRMSDFAVQTTSRREQRTLPGKLPQLEAQSTQISQATIRPMMRLRPPRVADSVTKIIQPSVRREKRPEEASPLSRRYHGQFAPHIMDPTGQESDGSPKRRQPAGFGSVLSVRDESEAHDQQNFSFKAARIDKPQMALCPEGNLHSHVLTQRERVASSTTGNLPTRLTASNSTESIQLRPLRLQASACALSTPIGPAVSVTDTSPNTTVSQPWTPEASNISNSVFTDATRMSAASELPRSKAAVNRPARLFGAESAQYREAKPTSSLDSLDPTSNHGLQSQSRCCDRTLDGGTGPRHSGYHPMPASPRSCSGQTRASSICHSGRQGRLRYESEYASRLPRDDSSTCMAGFEISFELTEPKMAPHAEQATLLEFGLRMHIKPTLSSDSSSSLWTLKRSSRSSVERRLDGSERNTSAPLSMQYEYSHLSKQDMCKVQEEAQEYLSHTLASPDQRKRRLYADGGAHNAFFSAHDNHVPSASCCSAERSSARLPTSSRQALREFRLTSLRQPCASHSVAPSSIVSHSCASRKLRHSLIPRPLPSAGLSSPLPYIKRAPPRTASSSTFLSHS